MPLRDMDREQMWLLPPSLDELLPSMRSLIEPRGLDLAYVTDVPSALRPQGTGCRLQILRRPSSGRQVRDTIPMSHPSSTAQPLTGWAAVSWPPGVPPSSARRLEPVSARAQSHRTPCADADVRLEGPFAYHITYSLVQPLIQVVRLLPDDVIVLSRVEVKPVHQALVACVNHGLSQPMSVSRLVVDAASRTVTSVSEVSYHDSPASRRSISIVVIRAFTLSSNGVSCSPHAVVRSTTYLPPARGEYSTYQSPSCVKC